MQLNPGQIVQLNQVKAYNAALENLIVQLDANQQLEGEDDDLPPPPPVLARQNAVLPVLANEINTYADFHNSKIQQQNLLARIGPNVALPNLHNPLHDLDADLANTLHNQQQQQQQQQQHQHQHPNHQAGNDYMEEGGSRSRKSRRSRRKSRRSRRKSRRSRGKSRRRNA